MVENCGEKKEKENRLAFVTCCSSPFSRSSCLPRPQRPSLSRRDRTFFVLKTGFRSGALLAGLEPCLFFCKNHDIILLGAITVIQAVTYITLCPGRIKYVVRPVLPFGCKGEVGLCEAVSTRASLHLGGYSAELALKIMENKAIDDSTIKKGVTLEDHRIEDLCQEVKRKAILSLHLLNHNLGLSKCLVIHFQFNN